MGWLRTLLENLYLADRPIVEREGRDRRREDRRWMGREKELPRGVNDPRRKKERRKKKRRG